MRGFQIAVFEYEYANESHSALTPSINSGQRLTFRCPHPDLSLRSGRPSPKMGEGKLSPILGEMPEG